MATFTGTIKLVADCLLNSGLDIGTGKHQVNSTYSNVFTNGTGANQANEMFTDQRTIAASGSEDLDLAGSLTDAFGTSIVFTSIKAVIISAASANTNDVVVGGAASNTFDGWFNDSSDKLNIKPGGMFCITNPEANGYAVTAGTGDLLTIANSSSGTSVTYDIIIIGEI